MKPMNKLVIAAILLAGCKGKSKPVEETKPESEAPPVTTPRPSQQPQAQLPPLVLPDDPKRNEKIALGHVLFFDKRLSGKNDRSCYSCHQNEDGLGGHDPVAI